jgi:Zn-dependent M16 (insulinase) family peptidase
VITLPTIESSFVNHVGKGIQGFGHPDYPALRVAAEVLSATESFLWVSNCPSSIPMCLRISPQRYIRGSGLAYGAYVGIDLEAGRVTFSLYRVRSGIIRPWLSA